MVTAKEAFSENWLRVEFIEQNKTHQANVGELIYFRAISLQRGEKNQLKLTWNTRLMSRKWNIIGNYVFLFSKSVNILI